MLTSVLDDPCGECDSGKDGVSGSSRGVVGRLVSMASLESMQVSSFWSSLIDHNFLRWSTCRRTVCPEFNFTTNDNGRHLATKSPKFQEESFTPLASIWVPTSNSQSRAWGSWPSFWFAYCARNQVPTFGLHKSYWVHSVLFRNNSAGVCSVVVWGVLW